jgi:hypothetical protein
MLDFDPPQEGTYWLHEGQMWMLMKITDKNYIFQTQNRDEKIVQIETFGKGWEQRTDGWDDFTPTKRGPAASPSCNIL